MADQSQIYVGVAGYFGKPDHKGKVGVFRRSASGGDWQHVLGTVEAYTVVVHPKDPETVFAGTSDGVWRSTDRGATFRRTAFPDDKKQVWCFMIDSRDPKRIFAGASPIDVYRSDDKGASWRKLPTPAMGEYCTGPFAPRVMRMAQIPGKPGHIIAALEINGAMFSADGGETWTDQSADLIRLSELPGLGSKIVQQMTAAEGMLDGHAISTSAADPGAAIIAVRMGLFRTTDNGKTWTKMEASKFSPTTYGRDIRVSRTDPKTMYAALSVAAASHDGGVYRTTDGGKSWSRFDRVQVHGTIMSIGLHPSDPDQVYIGARYKGEVFGTTDGGKTWQDISIPVEVKDIYSVACN
jgi:photosystem II stability/assembly factor-like uncharacterized protein